MIVEQLSQSFPPCVSSAFLMAVDAERNEKSRKNGYDQAIVD